MWKPWFLMLAVIAAAESICSAQPAPDSPSAATASFAEPGPYQVSTRFLSGRRPRGGNCQMIVYYPAMAEGDAQPVNRGDGPYPIIVFSSPIAIMSLYAETYTHLASWGFIVIVPANTFWLFPDVVAIAADQTACLNAFIQQNSKTHSPFHGMFDAERCGFFGHSWGGSCVIANGAIEGPRLKAAVALGPWPFALPQPEKPLRRMNCPLFFLEGTLDINSPYQKVRAIYGKGIPVKSFYALQGGDHNFGDSGGVLALIPWTPAEFTLPHEEQIKIARHYLTAIMLLYLHDRDELWPLLWDEGSPVLPNVVRDSASGIHLAAAAQMMEGLPGETVWKTVTVTNCSTRRQAFELFVDESDWPAQVKPTSTTALNPAEQATVQLGVTIPVNPTSSSDSLRFSARSGYDGHTRNAIRVATKVLAN